MPDGSMKICKHTTRILGSLTLLFCLSSCSKNLTPTENDTPPASSTTANAIHGCGFRASAFAGDACKVSFTAILANPEKYAGRRIFTYTYMVKEADGAKFTFLAEPRIRSAPDFASCALLGQQSERDDKDLSGLRSGAIYSVSFAATFSISENYICAGKFDDVDFQDVALEAEAGVRVQFP